MSYQRNLKNEDGTEETIVISSNDNYKINLGGKYRLANCNKKKENKLVKKFKGTLLGADIGVKSSGFSNVAILATIIAVGVLMVMYLLWRF